MVLLLQMVVFAGDEQAIETTAKSFKNQCRLLEGGQLFTIHASKQGKACLSVSHLSRSPNVLRTDLMRWLHASTANAVLKKR